MWEIVGGKKRPPLLVGENAITVFRLDLATMVHDMYALSTTTPPSCPLPFAPRPSLPARCPRERYKYMGLQYSQDCFCGDTYFTAERDAVPSDECTMPCNGDESVICGGPWANSIYIVGDPAQMTPAELEVSFQRAVFDPNENSNVLCPSSSHLHEGAGSMT